MKKTNIIITSTVTLNVAYLTPPTKHEEVMFSPGSVCWFVCLFVRNAKKKNNFAEMFTNGVSGPKSSHFHGQSSKVKDIQMSI